MLKVRIWARVLLRVVQWFVNIWVAFFIFALPLTIGNCFVYFSFILFFSVYSVSLRSNVSHSHCRRFWLNRRLVTVNDQFAFQRIRCEAWNCEFRSIFENTTELTTTLGTFTSVVYDSEWCENYQQTQAVIRGDCVRWLTSMKLHTNGSFRSFRFDFSLRRFNEISIHRQTVTGRWYCVTDDDIGIVRRNKCKCFYGSTQTTCDSRSHGNEKNV